jgi:thiol:disulfide interchange protein DsbC
MLLAHTPCFLRWPTAVAVLLVVSACAPKPDPAASVATPVAAPAAASAAAVPTQTDLAQLRKNLAERLPSLPPIDEISATPIPGVFEVRMGADLIYSDATGDHIVQGEIIDTRSRTNLTESRLNKLSAISFASLPLKDAITIKQGSGSRRMAVFVDPNCGYCKRFERDVAGLKDVTVYTFLYPILGPDSTAKSRDIWCAKDPAKAWRSWMLDNTPAPSAAAACDVAALDRNTKFGRQHRVTGTPAAVFEDGTRAPGAIPAAQLEKLLAAAKPG